MTPVNYKLTPQRAHWINNSVMLWIFEAMFHGASETCEGREWVINVSKMSWCQDFACKTCHTQEAGISRTNNLYKTWLISDATHPEPSSEGFFFLFSFFFRNDISGNTQRNEQISWRSDWQAQAHLCTLLHLQSICLAAGGGGLNWKSSAAKPWSFSL